MNFLQLVNSLRQEAGIAGGDLSTVANVTGEPLRLVNWIKQAWLEIQEQRLDWEFMRKSFTFQTVANQQEYTATGISLSDFGWWVNESFRLYLTSAGVGNELLLAQIDWRDFRNYYLLNVRKITYSRPVHITVTPSRSLMLGFAPNDIYTVSGEYFITPQMLITDTDTPVMPDRYHMAIVYKAQQKYGLFESAQEQVTAGQQGYALIGNRMAMEQSPAIQIGAPFL